MLTLIFIIIAVGVLILAHEWGHFFVSRKLGVGVEEFGFGFPPRLISRVKNGVRYSINLLPFGGFVKIFGEHGEGEQDHRSFASRPAWQRVAILGAGVGMNLVLAWAVFSMGAALGVPQAIDPDVAVGAGATTEEQIPVSIIAVMPNSPAEQAGLKMGDQIHEIRTPELSLRIESEDDVRNFVDAYRGEEITLVIQRGSKIQEVNTMPRKDAPEGEGPLGIALARLKIVASPWYLAPIDGFIVLTRSITAIVGGFTFIVKELILGHAQSVPVSGPVGIYRYASETQQFGFAYFLQFVGILSVNLAILNVLPVPALDGGRILFVVLEKIKRKRVDPNLENKIHTVGFVVLVLLMVIVTYRDIAHIW
ncbi:MAG: site-2 protease family protein [Candidatus Sungbacteria bacterium]|nr:site-2 protease family protein [Candidatus Sungbacteria bacterium]